KLHPDSSSLIFATLIGGSAIDYAYDIVTDASDNIYIAGYTYSNNFPITAGAIDVVRGSREGYYAKLDPTGSTLLYSTFLGGGNYEEIMGIDLDPDGNPVLCGNSQSSDYPLTNDAAYRTNKGEHDGVITKFCATGDTLIYSTYIGGSGNDTFQDVEVDANGNIYLAGYGSSSDIPVTTNAIQSTSGGGYDAFLAKIDIDSIGPVVNYPPEIEQLGDTTINAGDSLVITVNATDVNNDSLTYTAAGLPSGADFTGNIFRWTPDSSQTGLHTVVFHVSDGAAADSDSVRITVTSAGDTTTNTAPEMDSVSALYFINHGDYLLIDLSASDSDGDPLTFSVSGNPTGSYIYNNSKFYWRPLTSESYNWIFNVTFKVSDGTDVDSVQTDIYFNQTSSDSAAVYQKNVISGFTGNYSSFAMSGTNADLILDTHFDYHYSSVGFASAGGNDYNQFATMKFWDLNIPSNARIDSAFLDLTQWGGSEVETVYIRALLKNFDPGDWTWNDYDKSASLSWSTPGALGIGTDITYDGYDSTYAADNAGFTFDLTGLIAASWGVDSTRPNYGWAIQPKNQTKPEYLINNHKTGFDAPKLKVYYTIVEVTNNPPVLAPIGNKEITENDSLTITLHATDTDGDSITFSAVNMPSGATFSDSTFTWVTDTADAGVYNVTFYAADSVSADSETVQITVNQFVNTAPVLDEISTYEIVPHGDIFTIELSAADADGDSLVFSVSNNPPDSYIINGNLFYWWPKIDNSYSNSYSPIFTVSDGQDTHSRSILLLFARSNSDSAVTYQKNDLTGFTGIGAGSATGWVSDNLNNTVYSAVDSINFAGLSPNDNFSAIRFTDINIPSNAQIDSASLVFTKYLYEDWGNPYSAHIRAILKDIDIYDFTWIDYDKSGSLTWTSPGAKSSGNDYTLDGTDSVAVTGQEHLIFDMTDLIKASYGKDSTRANYGWIVRGSDLDGYVNKFTVKGTNHNFESPKLRVYYSFPEVTNNPPVLAAIGNKEITENETLTFALSATDADGDSISFGAVNKPAGATFTDSTFTW
ncbi:Ig-like domain-containing protein, partial [candidate division KSB1 bacterium]